MERGTQLVVLVLGVVHPKIDSPTLVSSQEDVDLVAEIVARYRQLTGVPIKMLWVLFTQAPQDTFYFVNINIRPANAKEEINMYPPIRASPKTKNSP